MRGVYSIPAVIEVCVMNRICTPYVPYGHPLFFPVLCTSYNKRRRQSFLLIRAEYPLKNPRYVQHMEITPFDITKGEGHMI